MAKLVRKNYKKYYDRNEIRYRPKFCIYKVIGDYRFIFETAYIKERFIPTYGGLFQEAYDNMKNGRTYNKIYLDGTWLFEKAMTKKEVFVESL